jgi:hypothetical protein
LAIEKLYQNMIDRIKCEFADQIDDRALECAKAGG